MTDAALDDMLDDGEEGAEKPRPSKSEGRGLRDTLESEIAQRKAVEAKLAEYEAKAAAAERTAAAEKAFTEAGLPATAAQHYQGDLTPEAVSKFATDLGLLRQEPTTEASEAPQAPTQEPESEGFTPIAGMGNADEAPARGVPEADDLLYNDPHKYAELLKAGKIPDRPRIGKDKPDWYGQPD